MKAMKSKVERRRALEGKDERRRLIKLSVSGGRGGEVPGGRTGGEYQTPSLFGEKDRRGLVCFLPRGAGHSLRTHEKGKGATN